MLRKIIKITLLLSFLCANVFAHTAIVENNGENRYKAIRLTPEIYHNSTLSDIRIKDGNGEEVPYFINSSNQTDYETSRQEYPMELTDSYTKEESFYFDYKVREIPDRDLVATSIETTVQHTGFAKTIQIYGSYDNLNWEFVQEDALYNIDGKTKLQIDFRSPQKYTHYRFKLGNNLEKISFDSVTLVFNEVTQEKYYFLESITPKFTTEEKDQKTYIHIEGLKNLRLAEISIATDSMFQRYVTSSVGLEKELYHLTFHDTSYTDTTFPFDGRASSTDIFTLMIENGNDKPIHIKGITVRYYADELVFEGNQRGEYTLSFGADHTKTAPVYDIEKYQHEILKSPIDRLEIKELILDQPAEKPEQYDYKMIFNGLIVAVTILLGVLILRKLRK